MIETIFAVLLGVGNVQADTYVQAGLGFAGLRKQAYDVAIGYEPKNMLGVEVGFTSCGEQPDGYENINRMVTFSLVKHVELSSRLSAYGKLGVNNTKYSYNGTNTYDRSNDSLWGYQASVGLETPITKNTMLYGGVTVFEYRQVNNPNMGGFTYPSIGLRYVW